MTQDPQADRIAELEADNARLRRLLDQRDAPAELRHRLRSTAALLRAAIRQSADSRHDVEDYAAHLEDRLDTLIRVQSAVDARGEVNLHDLVAAELFPYLAREGERLRLDGPGVLLQPRAAQVLALAVNAVEHGVLGLPSGEIAVSWNVDPAAPWGYLTLEWVETGGRRLGEPARRGFGTTVLTEMVGHELKAETATALAPTGLRYRLRFPLSKRVGRVAASAIE